MSRHPPVPRGRKVVSTPSSTPTPKAPRIRGSTAQRRSKAVATSSTAKTAEAIATPPPHRTSNDTAARITDEPPGSYQISRPSDLGAAAAVVDGLGDPLRPRQVEQQAQQALAQEQQARRQAVAQGAQQQQAEHHTSGWIRPDIVDSEVGDSFKPNTVQKIVDSVRTLLVDVSPHVHAIRARNTEAGEILFEIDCEHGCTAESLAKIGKAAANCVYYGPSIFRTIRALLSMNEPSEGARYSNGLVLALAKLGLAAVESVDGHVAASNEDIAEFSNITKGWVSKSLPELVQVALWRWQEPQLYSFDLLLFRFGGQVARRMEKMDV
jgi:hypothetical protein